MAIRPVRRQVPQYTIAQDVYQSSIAKHAHILLQMGYARLIPPAFQHCEEEVITGELVKAMRIASEEQDAPRWVRYYAIHDDPPINTEGREGRRRRRVDIEFERVQYGPRPRFQFEAKRLCGNASVGDYLGPDGLGCYFAGDDAYAQWHPEAGMLGYVQLDTEDDWAARIQAKLEQSPAKYAMRIDGNWQHVRMSKMIPNIYRTKHDRVLPQRPLTIFHRFLRFW